MKLIHCADIHLGSSLTANFEPAAAQRRKAELFRTFTDLLDHAEQNHVDAVLIAGDLFDRTTGISALRENVMQAFAAHPDLLVFYLCGNHDLNTGGNLPDNVYGFTDEWTQYRLSEHVMLSGIEPSDRPLPYQNLHLEENDVNLVMMHGQITSSYENTTGEMVSLASLKTMPIDYLALGHLHAYHAEPLNHRGVYCYPGCLEGRGFDEPGEHGFVELDIDESSHTVNSRFVPFARHHIYRIQVDVTGCETSFEMAQKVKDALAVNQVGSEDYAEAELVGELSTAAETDPVFIPEQVSGMVRFLQVKNHTALKIDYTQYEMDESLKGEFVRQIAADTSLSEQEKAEIIRTGMAALSGKEL